MISILFFGFSAISSAKDDPDNHEPMELSGHEPLKQLRIPLLVFTFANVVLVLAGQF